MEKLIENLISVFGNADVNDIKVNKDKDGNTTIFIAKKKDNTELRKIRQEIEDLDDEVFEAAAARLKISNPTAFKVMMTIEEENPEMKSLLVAYKIFKAVVKEVVEQKIKEYTEEVNRLFSKYLDNKGE